MKVFLEPALPDFANTQGTRTFLEAVRTVLTSLAGREAVPEEPRTVLAVFLAESKEKVVLARDRMYLTYFLD